MGQGQGYLDGLSSAQARQLAEINRAGLRALTTYLAEGEAVAFLGAGVSAPLYPLWSEVIAELVAAAVERGLGSDAAATCRALAGEQPDAVVEIVGQHLGAARYQAALRETFRVRRDPETGRTWTLTQELVCRCAFKAVVTTNYDPGIVDARMRVRPRASGTGFFSWKDELSLDRWRTGDVFDGVDELPVLFAHGHHNQPDAMVLATTEYRQAYAGKLSAVLARMIEAWHLVWLGFSFADQRIAAVLREVAEHSAIQLSPGTPPRHVAVMGWDPASGGDPGILRRLAAIRYGAELVLYPAPGRDHSALQRLLAGLADERYLSAQAKPTLIQSPSTTSDRPEIPAAIPMRWVHGVQQGRPFVGRVEQLASLDRWAGDPSVRLIGVTAWGGAGKTALVTHWLDQRHGASNRPGVLGVFGWSFYANPSAEHWAQDMLNWATMELGVDLADTVSLAAGVLAVIRAVPVVLVLDGLEVVQEGPASDAYGRLLNGVLREVLTATCRSRHHSLVILTSRFSFADLAGFDGTSVRILEVTPFTVAEGAALLASADTGGLTALQLQTLVADVDGHALAVATMAGLLAAHPGSATFDELRTHLTTATRTQEKVARVLDFYGDRLDQDHRCLIAVVSLFERSVRPAQVLAVAADETFAMHLSGWDTDRMQAAARGPLAGLLSWHPDATISAHPLVRAAFRPLALGAARVAAEVSLTDTPRGTVTTRIQAQKVVEAIELCLDAGLWRQADLLYSRTRKGTSGVWQSLPAARLGQRAAAAFVANPSRVHSCANMLSNRVAASRLNDAGLSALYAGDLAAARTYLDAALDRNIDNRLDLVCVLSNLTECLVRQGQGRAARQPAVRCYRHATSANDKEAIRDSYALLAWVAYLTGDTAVADEQFLAADRIHYRNGTHLHSAPAIVWATFLVSTDRLDVARRLTERNLIIAEQDGWNSTIAQCQVILARLDLLANDTAKAGGRITQSVQCFRDGDYLVDLADALCVAAEHARCIHDLESAEALADEALDIACPRNLTPTHAAALTVRARIGADRYIETGDETHLAHSRDAASAAFRLATYPDPIPWAELDALNAQVYVDIVEGAHHDWAPRAIALRERLIPSCLDPDPLLTVETDHLSGRRKRVRGSG